MAKCTWEFQFSVDPLRKQQQTIWKQFMLGLTKMVVVVGMLMLTAGGCGEPTRSDQDPGISETFEEPVFGLTISRPGSWRFITPEESRARISDTKLKDEGIGKLVSALASRPIVIILKSRRRIPLPTIQITVNPLEDTPEKSAVAILQRMSGLGGLVFKDYSIVDGPFEMEIAGHEGAYMKARYTGEFQGDRDVYPTSYETWIVMREEYFFMISAVACLEEDGETPAEIAWIIESIELR